MAKAKSTPEISYNWIVNNLECYPKKDEILNVVTTIHWSLEASKTVNDVYYSTLCYGSCAVELDPTAPFIEFNDLTKEIVVKWIENSLGTEKIDLAKNNLSSQLEYIINPPSVSLSPPWTN